MNATVLWNELSNGEFGSGDIIPAMEKKRQAQPDKQNIDTCTCT